MLNKAARENLVKQHYGIVGSHSACKVCTWTKKSLKDEDECYKSKFYGIRSWLCCQMTPSLACTNKCVFCWRDLSTPTIKKFPEKADSPKEIIENCIKENRQLLSGFGGDIDVNKKKYRQALNPKHFAISLTGEPTLYPKLKELIEELHKQGKTTFVVSNGMFPEVLKKIKPTQLYISVDAPNKRLYEKIDKSIYKDAWQRLNKSLEIMKSLRKKTRTCLRITAIKGLNLVDEEGYAKIIKKSRPLFVEVKGYMWVGSSRLRLKNENMPMHNEVKEFAENIANLSKYKIIDEKKESRVILLMEKDFKGRIMKF